MKIYSTKITRFDILEQLHGIADVYVDDSGIREFTPRRGGAGFEVYLEGLGDRHVRARNGRYGNAATWDDYGVWMERLFTIDPDAEIAWYKGHAAFVEETTRQHRYRGMRAPWLDEDVSIPFAWPDEEQVEQDAALIERKRKRTIREEARHLRLRAERLEASL